MKIRRAIIPVAGLGTRFLPATKTIAKEMLPIVDKPCIQYIIEEAVESGITEIILITSKGKKTLEDYFDIAFELEYHLKERHKNEEIKKLKEIEKMANFIYIRQDQPLGDGHAILRAKELVKDEPFAVLFGDDIYDSKTPVLAQLIKEYEKIQQPVIALEKVPMEIVNRYGVITPVKKNGRLHEIGGFQEKPKQEEAASNLTVVGKYIVTPDLLEELIKVKRPKSQELKLIDAMQKYVKKQPIYGLEVEGTRFDTGDKFGFIKANIHFALKHKTFGKDVKKYIKSLI